jgi:signal transduction histidine kinase
VLKVFDKVRSKIILKISVLIFKGITESHGGKIWIDNNYTSGTSISFTLPIADENDGTDGT